MSAIESMTHAQLFQGDLDFYHASSPLLEGILLLSEKREPVQGMHAL